MTPSHLCFPCPQTNAMWTRLRSSAANMRRNLVPVKTVVSGCFGCWICKITFLGICFPAGNTSISWGVLIHFKFVYTAMKCKLCSVGSWLQDAFTTTPIYCSREGFLFNRYFVISYILAYGFILFFEILLWNDALVHYKYLSLILV